MPISGGGYALPTNGFAQPVAGQLVDAAEAAETLTDIETAIDTLAGVIEDGDKGDITVSSNGTVWSIDAGAVGAAELATDAVETAKIKDANVTTAKIADNNVTMAKLEQGAARSVIMRSANSTGNFAASAPAAGSFNLLMESNNVLGWSKLIYQNIDSTAFASQVAAEAGTDTSFLMNALRVAQAISAQCFLRVAGVWGADDTNDATATYTVGADTHAFLLFQRGAGGPGGTATAYAGGGGGGQGGCSIWLFTDVTPGTELDLFLSKGGATPALSYAEFPLALTQGAGSTALQLQVSNGTGGTNASGATPGRGGIAGTTGTNTVDQGGTAVFPAGWGVFHFNIPGVYGSDGHYEYGGRGGGYGDVGFGGNGADVGGSATVGWGAYFTVLEFVLGNR